MVMFSGVRRVAAWGNAQGKLAMMLLMHLGEMIN
jgi:hypothetical protein